MIRRAARHDMELQAFADWAETIVVRVERGGAPIDLTGCTAQAQIRPDHASQAILVAMTGGNGRADITDPVGGEITLAIPAEVAGRIGAPCSDAPVAVWDLRVLDAEGRPSRLLEGDVYLFPGVDR